jgi:hypothetical protein
LITRTEIVDFRTDAPERTAMAAASVASLIDEIFEGPGVAPLCVALRGGGVNVFKVALYFDAAVLVGFAMVVHDTAELDGRTVAIGRAICGLRREWRGRQTSTAFFLACGLSLLRHHRGKELWGFVPAMHVSSYRVIARVPGVVPHPRREVSDRQIQWIDALARRFGCERAEGDHPLVCRRPLRVKGARQAPRPSERPDDALDRFFFEINPAHAEGACVMTLFPVTHAKLLVTLARYAVHRVRRALGRPVARAAGVRASAVEDEVSCRPALVCRQAPPPHPKP